MNTDLRNRLVPPAVGALLVCAGLFCGVARGQAPKIDEAKLDQAQLAAVKDRFGKLDADHDGKLTKQENPDQAFTRIDVNGDGFITLDEAISMLVAVDEAKLDQAQLAVVKGRFTQLDANHDGKVTPQEFPEPGFKRLDLNNDGFITYVESVSVLVPLSKTATPPAQPARVSEAQVEQIFKFKDKDGDGKLTPAEVNNPEQFKLLDANGDGFVTLAEAKALYALPAGGGQAVPEASFTPLIDLGKGQYKGSTGGLYPDGANTPPPAYLEKGLAVAKAVQPLNAEGKPAADGLIGLISIGMSNTAMEYAAFKDLADADAAKNPRVRIVNCAWPGVDTTRMKNPQDFYWTGIDTLMNKGGLSNPQVQVIWFKQATINENRGFPQDAQGLKDDMTAIITLLQARFLNLKLIYVSSRTYGGYATTPLNPEPAAYDSGFAVKWLIEDRITANVDGPWIAWGPYLWTDGARGRGDKFVWLREDTDPKDGTHPSKSGCEKVGNLLLQFFKTEETAKGWFLK